MHTGLKWIFLLLLLSASVCNSTNLAFVYKNTSAIDSTSALSFKLFLDSRGYTTTLIKMSDVPVTNFSGYQCILIGDATGNGNTWGDSASVATIKNAYIPVVGIGEGGYAFFGKLFLAIGWGMGAHGSSDSLSVVDTSTSVYRSPNPIPVLPGGGLHLYNVSSPQVVISNPVPAGGVVFLGAFATGSFYAPLVTQHARFLLWGYSNPPDSMTATGKNLFHNCVELVRPNLVAWYPLTSTGKDTTTTLDSLYLLNTSFQRGGVFCNGIYSGPSATRFATPTIAQLNYSSFSISAKFVVPDSAEGFNPVFIGGDSYRWLGFYISDSGSVGMKYNNSITRFGNTYCSLNDEHDALVSYDSTTQTGSVYFDNTLVFSASFKLLYSSDKRIGTTDFSNAGAFRGVIRDLKIYNSVITPVATVPLQVWPRYAGVDMSPDQTFRWRRVTGASSYRLQISTDSTFVGGKIVNASGLADTSYRYIGLPGYTAVYWRVSTSSGAWSTVWKLTIGIPYPSQVVLMAPSPGAGLVPDNVGFLWHTAQPWVTEYRFVLASDSMLATKILDTLVLDTTITLKNVGYSATRWWTVTAKNVIGYSIHYETRKFTTTATGVTEQEQSIPTTYSLSQNFPNPFNPATEIRYELPAASLVRLAVYDMLGREIAVLINERRPAGRYVARWNASGIASGLYFCRITAGNFTETRRMVLVK